MDKIINLRLLANPINWVTVALMVAIGGFGSALIVSHYHHADPLPKKDANDF